MGVASRGSMATHVFKNDEEREISRGGRATAIWILCIGLFMISFGILGASLIREHVSPPARPGTTPGITSAGERQAPSPSP